MTEKIETLARLIRAERARGARPVSRLGYFCAPFRPAEGPFSDRVIKVYRALPDRDAGLLEQLAAAHAGYVALLGEAGVPLPETEFRLVPLDGGRAPVIVQEALPPESMMRPQIRAATPEQAVALMEAAGQVIARFWHAVREHPGRVGFHPSIRNFAVRDGEAVFFDTFPPLIGYSREDMGRLLLVFSDKRLMRLVGPLLRARVTSIQDEWYSPAETLVGLVGSACRLRPSEVQRFLDWGRDFAGREMAPWQDEIRQGLATPPRLPREWTALRRLLGLEGEPNL
jgi:hypothetical protein